MTRENIINGIVEKLKIGKSPLSSLQIELQISHNDGTQNFAASIKDSAHLLNIFDTIGIKSTADAEITRIPVRIVRETEYPNLIKNVGHFLKDKWIKK